MTRFGNFFVVPRGWFKWAVFEHCPDDGLDRDIGVRLWSKIQAARVAQELCRVQRNEEYRIDKILGGAWSGAKARGEDRLK